MSTPVIYSLLGTPRTPELVFTRAYRVPASDLHSALTDIERLSRWFGTITGDPSAPGDAFSAQLSDDPDDAARGTVVECAPGLVRVTWSWQGESESIITARVTDADDGSTLTLHHELAEPDHAVGYGGGWSEVLESLARSLGVASPDAQSNEQIEAEAVARWRTITRGPLVMSRTIDAPIDVVWAKFTTPEGMRSWWWSHWDDVEIRVDARVGGVWYTAAPAVGMSVGGTYLAVDEGERLAFTWEWVDEEGASVNEAVDIRFRREGEGTVIDIVHSGPWEDDTQSENYREGWNFVLDALDAVFS